MVSISLQSTLHQLCSKRCWKRWVRKGNTNNKTVNQIGSYCAWFGMLSYSYDSFTLRKRYNIPWITSFHSTSFRDSVNQTLWADATVYVEFACFPCVCVGFSQGTLVSSCIPEMCTLGSVVCLQSPSLSECGCVCATEWLPVQVWFLLAPWAAWDRLWLFTTHWNKQINHYLIFINLT